MADSPSRGASAIGPSPAEPEQSAHGEAPSPHERAGRLETFYSLWAEGEIDPAASARAMQFFDDVFRLHEIAPIEQHIACTRQLCRARLGFANMVELRNLARVDRRRVPEFAPGDPYETEDGVLSIVVYLALDGKTLPRSGP